jgi:outer membrane protein assembly factor BamB
MQSMDLACLRPKGAVAAGLVAMLISGAVAASAPGHAHHPAAGLATTAWPAAVSAAAAVPAPPGQDQVTAPQARSSRSTQASPVSSNWAQYRYSASQDGYNPREKLLSPSNVSQLGVAWSYTFSNATFTPAAVAGGTLYASTAFAVDAFDASTGALLWSYAPNGGPFYFSAPAVVNRKVYITSTDATGEVYALNGTTGALLWSYNTSAAQMTPPTVAGGLIYTGTSGGRGGDYVYALKAATGVLAWLYDSGPVSASPAVANATVYVDSTSSVEYALDATTGAQKWIAILATPGGLDATAPALANGLVYLSDAEGQVYALNAATGETEWERTLTSTGNGSSPALAGKTLYIGSGNNVYALNALTGATRWLYPTGGAVASSPSLANHVVYIGSEDGNLYALNATSGAMLWSYTAGDMQGTSPAVANGMVYSGFRTLYAFGLPTGIQTHQPTAPRTSGSLLDQG